MQILLFILFLLAIGVIGGAILRYTVVKGAELLRRFRK